MRGRKIAILGGGMSGLTSIKACLEEDLEPVCFESTDDVGGLWRYRPEDLEGVSSLPKSTVINTSKEPTAFSDFPPPKDFPNYMHNRYMCKYFNLYADHFGLKKYVKLNHKVVRVTFAEDYEDTGRWSVTVERTDTNSGGKELITDTYDGVMVCTGHHVIPFIPEYEGMDNFKGTITHTHSYKVPNGYEDKKVLVVGNGNSGSDVAIDISAVAEQVYLSTRRGFWIRYRLGPQGYPGDLKIRTRSSNLGLIPFKLNCYLQEREAQQKLDYERYGLKATHRILSQHPTVSDALPNKIISGAVKIKGPIRKLVPSGALFEGERDTVHLDAIILATGYKVGFPFLEGDIANVNDEECELYLYVFPPRLKHPTLAFIGNVQPLGPMFLISELQARYYAQVFTGNVKLPSVEEMMTSIRQKAAINAKVYISGIRHVTEVVVIPYCDEIASKFGVKPDLWKLFWNDYPLFKACFFKAHLAYQYRLQGPHAWEGARDAIMTYEDRVLAAFDTNTKAVKTRVKQREQKKRLRKFKTSLKRFFILVLISGIFYLVFAKYIT